MRKQGIDYQRLAVNLVDKRAKLIKICNALNKDVATVDGAKINLLTNTWLCGVPMSEVAELLGDIKPDKRRAAK